MKEQIAKQIADLLNRRNQLNHYYTADDILLDTQDYIYETEDDILTACVATKKVQWYQWEIFHLSVEESYERRGYGSRLIIKAEKKAIEGGAKILQCTIRIGNKGSENVFSKCGFKKVASFYYPNTGNDVGVWQKVVSTQT